jgi:superfamily II DNA helicase RecQ
MGNHAVLVNEDHNSPELLADIKACKYTMVFLSVEMASRMRDTLQSTPFSRRLAGLVVDEAHVVTDWGQKDFREEYRHLGNLKNLVRPALRCISSRIPRP